MTLRRGHVIILTLFCLIHLYLYVSIATFQLTFKHLVSFFRGTYHCCADVPLSGKQTSLYLLIFSVCISAWVENFIFRKIVISLYIATFFVSCCLTKLSYIIESGEGMWWTFYSLITVSCSVVFHQQLRYSSYCVVITCYSGYSWS